MTKAGLADHHNLLSDNLNQITTGSLLKMLTIVIAITFLLRIFYAGHLYEDDGLWFTAAEEVLRGNALYREIYFDKPPGLALVYSFLFLIFGAHVISIRLFTIAYSVAISAVLYLFGSRLYDKRLGLLAAALFAVFSTTYATGHFQGLGTDFLMSLPYTGAAYLLIRSRIDSDVNRNQSHQTLLAFFGGCLIGVAFQINPKGIFDLLFFVGYLIVWRWWIVRFGSLKERPEAGIASASNIDLLVSDNKEHSIEASPSSWKLLGLAIAGVAAGSAPFVAYIAATRSLREYWLYVWDWGARYGSYNSAAKVLVGGLTRSLDYFLLNNTLLIALVFVAIITAGRFKTNSESKRTYPAGFRDDRTLLLDATLLLWFVVSYAGVVLGGRLFSHYFLQALPGLCLIGARGVLGIRSGLKAVESNLRRAAIAVIALGFVFTIVRFHGRTATLALDLFRGQKSSSTAAWFHDRIDREERMVAAVLRELPEGEHAADLVGLESMRADGPRTREVRGPADFIFVWGYRPELYYFSGLLPASRYLSTQPLTGVPADVHYFGDDYRSILNDRDTASARAQLLSDLQTTRPKYIVDELGMFNADLSINSYAELSEFMRDYKAIGPVERFMIYCRRDLLKKNLRRTGEKPQDSNQAQPH